jgi:hypothetical protein
MSGTRAEAMPSISGEASTAVPSVA